MHTPRLKLSHGIVLVPQARAAEKTESPVEAIDARTWFYTMSDK